MSTMNSSFEFMYEVYKNVCFMLNYRNYTISSKINSLDKFIEKYKRKQIYIYDDTKSIVVNISKGNKFIKKHFMLAMRGFKRYSTLINIIIIIPGKVGSNVLRNIDPNKLSKDLLSYNISFMSINNFIINKINHNLVPKHEIVKDLKIIKSLEKNNIPSIKLNDSIIELIGGKIGDIIKITRFNKNKIHDVSNELRMGLNIHETVYNIVKK